MKKVKEWSRGRFLCFALVFVLSFFTLNGEEKRHPLRLGGVLRYYNEPLLRPGVTLGLDWEYSLDENRKLGVTIPGFTYFYFPDNLYSLAFYTEAGYRHIGEKGFYSAISLGTGISLSKKIVPVYNLLGEEIDPPYTKQLYLSVQLALGADLSILGKKDIPARLYGTIGWKGLYPNNLSILNQALIQVGLNYKVANL